MSRIVNIMWWRAEGEAIGSFYEDLDRYVILEDLEDIKNEIFMAHALYCTWREWDE